MQPRTWRILLAALFLVVVLPPGSAGAQPPPPALRFQYAAKIICGTGQELPGTVSQPYATSININNPNVGVDTLRKSLIVTTPPGRQRPVRARPVATDILPPQSALSTDCGDLRARVSGLPASFEGFVLIDSTQSLDVVSVYSVPGGIDIVHVPERQRR